jgi:hypothetical protein
MSDWFKYYRSSSDHHLRKKPTVWLYWLHCLESVSWKDHTVFWDGKEVHLEPGSFITSIPRDQLKNSFSSQQVRWARRVLQRCSMITVKTSNAGSLITVCNWRKHQAQTERATRSKEQANDSPVADEQQMRDRKTAITEEGKKVKKGRTKKITTAAPQYSEAFEKFWKVYPKHEDKAEAFELFLELEKNYFPENELEKDLIKFAFAYAAEFKGARKKYAKKAKYILRDAEWKYWMEGAPQENTPREEPKPPPTGLSSLSSYTMMAKNNCPDIDPAEIRKAFDEGINIKQLIENHA